VAPLFVWRCTTTALDTFRYKVFLVAAFDAILRPVHQSDFGLPAGVRADNYERICQEQDAVYEQQNRALFVERQRGAPVRTGNRLQSLCKSLF
jgi:hypothetical protein